MGDCIFCGIENEKKPNEMPYQDDRMVAFNDTKPSAPVHVLMVPKKHITSIATLEEEDASLIGDMIYQLRKIAEAKGIEKAFKIVINNGRDGGQIIDHLHIHLLGGKKFKD